jgi:hypothetical protein
MRAGLAQHVEGRLKVMGAGASEEHIAAGHGRSHRIGAGLDAVGHDLVGRAVQFIDALDGQRAGADAVDLRAHRHEALGDVGDLGLHGGVLDHRLALGERRGHQDDVRGADRDLGEHDAVAAQAALRRLGDDIALVDVDLGPKLLEAVEEQIDRARADGAAAGQRHARLVGAGEQRADDPEAGAHGRDQLVGRGGIDDLGGLQRHALAVEMF